MTKQPQKNNRFLDILIVTHGNQGLEPIVEMNLPQVEGVYYIVSWQNGGSTDFVLPEALDRPEIKVYPTASIGSGANHHDSIAHSEAPYCLLADNDLKYDATELREVISTIAANPDVDLFLFKYRGATKQYPAVETDMSKRLPRCYSVPNFEMSFKRMSIVGKIRFHEQFGVGARFECGEDTLFFSDCRRAGLNCRFFPIIVTTHEGSTTGSRPIEKANIAMGEGAIIRYNYGLAGLPRVLLFAWRNYRSGRLKFWWGLRHLLAGFMVNIKS